MILSWAQVLMLPLDVSNSREFGGGIRMDIFWFIVYITTAVFLLIIIPFLIFYYEADPDWTFVSDIINDKGTETKACYMFTYFHFNCYYFNFYHYIRFYFRSILFLQIGSNSNKNKQLSDSSFR